MMFIVFGTRGRHKKLGEGIFNCPQCGQQRAYHHKKIQRYLSLYFVPVVPMDTVTEYIECQTCGTTFQMEAMSMKAPPRRPRDLAQALNQIEDDLRAGNPVEFIVRDLTAAGLDRDVALRAIEPFTASTKKHCTDCGLTYLNSITHCQNCGKELTEV
jgi:ribosomal protein L37AE/L43A